MANNLYELVYTSVASEDLSHTQLLQILEKARVNNKRREITGMLVYDNREIMQLLDQQVQGISAAMPQAQQSATDEVQPASPSEDHDVPADQQAADRVEDQA